VPAESSDFAPAHPVQRLFSPTGRDLESMTLLSHGGGQQSFAMLLLLLFDPAFRQAYAPGRAIAVCSDTGNEHEETLRHIREVEALCAARGLEYHHLRPSRGFHTPAWRSLQAHWRAGHRVGAKSFPKSCTYNLKINPQYKFLNHVLARDYGLPESRKGALYAHTALTGRKLTALIGFSAEEVERRVNPDEKVPKWLSANVERRYPLADLGMTTKGCQDLIRAYGFPVPYPSQCVMCPFKTPFDLAYMARFDRVGLLRWAVHERRKLRAHRRRFAHLPESKNHGVFGPETTLLAVAAKAVAEHAHITDAQMHDRRMAGHAVASRH
jgi:hypothetical protein